MAINENVFKGKWLELKGQIQKTWGKLTDDELEKTKGDTKELSGLIQQKYGHKEEEVKKRLSEMSERFKEKKDDALENTKSQFKD